MEILKINYIYEIQQDHRYSLEHFSPSCTSHGLTVKYLVVNIFIYCGIPLRLFSK